MSTTPGFIPPHGGYENLLSFQKTKLLDQQIRLLEQDFLKEGCLRQRMTKTRLAARAAQNRNNRI